MTDLSSRRPDVGDELVARIPPIVDLDAHVVEPADLWSSRLPKRYREVGLRVEYAPAGIPRLVGTGYVEEPGTDGPLVPWWRYEDKQMTIKRTIAAAGFAPEEVELKSVGFDEMRAGCHSVADRVLDMDVNGIAAQLCFPNLPRFCGQLFLWAKDRDLAKLSIEAYNDWMVEEWAGTSGGRLLPLCLVPLWDGGLAAAEIRRNAARGCRAVAFSEMPSYLDLPSIYTGHWDEMFRACEETGTVLCMHIGSGTVTPRISPESPDAVAGTVIFANSIVSMCDWLYSGVLHRFPKLQLMYAEAQIGWIPYVLERADDVWETHRGWSNSQLHCPEPPSTYYRRQVTSCFFKDAVGIRMLDRIGIDNVVFESDYPHQDSTWPYTREAAAQQFGGLDQPSIDKIARGNAIRLLGLDPMIGLGSPG
jgi:predicted TIM-barrel fold metal-dependent hydrolase